jgi:hypothetical protein
MHCARVVVGRRVLAQCGRGRDLCAMHMGWAGASKRGHNRSQAVVPSTPDVLIALPIRCAHLRVCERCVCVFVCFAYSSKSISQTVDRSSLFSASSSRDASAMSDGRSSSSCACHGKRQRATRYMRTDDRRQAARNKAKNASPESCANCRPRAAGMQRRQAYCVRERACVRTPAHGRVWVGSIQRAPTEAPRCAPACLAASLAGTPGRALPRAAVNPPKAKAQCVRRPEQPTAVLGA